MRVLLFVIVASLGTIFQPGWVLGDERILSYHSDIAVQPDGWLEVTERIAVKVEGKQIQRGIFRDFPQSYVLRNGLRQRRPFDVVSVRRNGDLEPFRVEAMSRGTRVWVGDPDVTLPTGIEQVYEISYRTDLQLILEEDGDELYWNVTGNEWAFPIDEVVAVVRLPPGARAAFRQAWTGPKGATGEDYTLDYREEGPRGDVAEFRATRPLAIGEGMTVALRWQPGLLDEQAYAKRISWRENLTIVVAVGLLAGALIVWLVLSREPRKGLVIPRWEPPAGLSPGAMRFVQRREFDETCFSVAVIGLAAKGVIRLLKPSEKDCFTLERLSSETASLEREEAKLLGELLSEEPTIRLHRENYRQISRAKWGFRSQLNSNFGGKYFRRNSVGWLIGTLIALAGIVVMSMNLDRTKLMFVGCVWVVGASILLSWAVLTLVRKIRQKDRPMIPAVTTWAVVSLGFWGLGMAEFWKLGGWLITVFLAVIPMLAVYFFAKMKIPTREGRKVLDEIDGFREYLSVAEEDRLNLENPPEMTPELFERFLPYALALGVSQEWSEKFDRKLQSAGREASGGQRRGSRTWHPSQHVPSFYVGERMNVKEMVTGAVIGAALTSALTTSSASPSSSRGSGGGSSGGGGGGGGGGGW